MASNASLFGFPVLIPTQSSLIFIISQVNRVLRFGSFTGVKDKPQRHFPDSFSWNPSWCNVP
jgi:hypothetical protein